MDKEQRDLYKQDFNAEYTKYLELYRIVREVSKRFDRLERETKGLQPGSESWKVR